jgi:hypothetical protein
MDVDGMTSDDDLICDRCGLAPREITIASRNLCGFCYCRYASELVQHAQDQKRKTAQPKRKLAT